MCYSRFGICCMLLDVCCVLRDVFCWLLCVACFVVIFRCRSLVVARCSQFVVCLLFVVGLLLFGRWCCLSLCVVRCVLFVD